MKVGLVPYVVWPELLDQSIDDVLRDKLARKNAAQTRWRRKPEVAERSRAECRAYYHETVDYQRRSRRQRYAANADRERERRRQRYVANRERELEAARRRRAKAQGAQEKVA